jgi:Dimerisation domain
MAQSDSGIGNVTPNAELVQMAMSYSRSYMLCAAARLGIADALGDEVRSVDHLAETCQADVDALYRLLRALASIGITEETTPKHFRLTPFGRPSNRNKHFHPSKPQQRQPSSTKANDLCHFLAASGSRKGSISFAGFWGQQELQPEITNEIGLIGTGAFEASSANEKKSHWTMDLVARAHLNRGLGRRRDGSCSGNRIPLPLLIWE